MTKKCHEDEKNQSKLTLINANKVPDANVGENAKIGAVCTHFEKVIGSAERQINLSDISVFLCRGSIQGHVVNKQYIFRKYNTMVCVS